MSLTVTQTLSGSSGGGSGSRGVGYRATRVHDYLYDPLYTISSEKDLARLNFQAHASLDRVKKVPKFRSMFSILPHYPSHMLCLESKDPVPYFIDRRWRGWAEQHRDALLKLSAFDPTIKVPVKAYEEPDVLGKDRYRYFERPAIPFIQQIPPNVVLELSRGKPYTGHGKDTMDRPLTPAFRTVGIQTDYRDGEAQTEPYSPEYVTRPGSAPELLTLATLTWGRGLPAGLAEVEMIERARAKRAWEATLPPMNDKSQLDKRRRMMDEMERKEWALREWEIEQLQEVRLEVLEKLLKEREQRQQDLNVTRLNARWLKCQREREQKVKKIRKEHIKKYEQYPT
uniref:Cilia- and flagella-associated protein 91 n=1 Tax=Latimeria chalumnae TaxID=7897 RepID=H3B261_LATCH